MTVAMDPSALSRKAGQKSDALPSFTKTWHASSYPSINPTRPELSSKGRSVIVTGGGTGIGASIALSFAQAGASAIGLVARREDKLQASKAAIEKLAPGIQVQYEIADVVDLPALEKAFNNLAAAFGKIDVLVANAGYLNIPTFIMETDPEDWWKVQEVNVRGTFNSIRAFAPVASEHSHLINISSGVAHLPATVVRRMSAYAVSKIGNAKLIEYAANQLKEQGMTVVTVQPGTVESEMTTNYVAGLHCDSPELPGDFCVWLASPEAGFLHGRFVYVNWDVDEMMARKQEIEGDPVLLTMTLDGVAV